MARRFRELLCSPMVKAVQERMGARPAHGCFEDYDAPKDRLDGAERSFIAARDGFYMASASETGWPYVQYRCGPKGFLKVLDENTLGFADYRGSREYVAAGNLMTNDRVSLFLMDYRDRCWLKILGRAREIGVDAYPELIDRLVDGHDARDRGMLIRVEAFDWNCAPQVAPRYTEEEFAERLASFIARLQAAETELELLRRQLP